NDFIKEMYQFAETHPEYKMFLYREVLEQMGFNPNKLRVEDVGVEDLDEQGTLVLLEYIMRADHFCEGVLHEYIRNGKVNELLKHLHELDGKGRDRKLAEIILMEDITTDYFTFHFIASGKKIINHTHEWYRTLSVFESRKFLEKWENLQTDHWRYSQELPCPGRKPTQWLLYSRYEGSRGWAVTGYKEGSEKWKELANLVGLAEHIERNEVRNPGEFIFCGIEFYEGGNRYHYLTEDESIRVGDEVIVPVGKENQEKIAIVEEIGYYRPDEAPFPVEKTKYILSKATEAKDRNISEISMTLYSDYFENSSKVVWAGVREGCLEIEEQVLGSCLPYDDGEHEMFHRFDENETRRFSELLTGQSDDFDIFLKRFVQKFKGPYWNDELRYFCKLNCLKVTMFGC
ncbi:MAG: hypothetical protein JXQ23_08275, partial [Clostridia bacterium]|nr:hypothetical protein [Clostridia bacterium]